MKKNELSRQLEHFLMKACDSKQSFLGRKQGSKVFQIHSFYNGLVIIQYDSYPKHYVLEKEVLLDGLDKVINHGLQIPLTSMYASEIEFSTVHRQGTNNRTSVLTKFYFSLHNGFLKTYKKNEKA